jgi:acyl phosphate:glycerol-3-phosphate acyltransferase
MRDTILGVLASYVLGAMPWSYLVARWAGRNIHQLGDGNVGAHNVMRHVGRGWGFLALALDAGKGAVAVLLANLLDGPPWLPLGAALAAVIGHNYPVWLGGRGGKGLATSFGIVLALFPALAWLILGGAVALVALTRNLAFSGVAVGVLLVPVAAMYGYGWAHTLAPLALIALMGVRQWSDLRRDWRRASNKRDLILNRWIRDREARL